MRIAIPVFACLSRRMRRPETKEFLNPPTMFAAGGYSNAVTVSGGKMVFVAGQVAFDAKGNIVGRGDLRAQFRQTYENVRAALAAAGATPDDVVKGDDLRRELGPRDAPRRESRGARALLHPGRILRQAPPWACRLSRSTAYWSRSRSSRW